MSAKKITIEDPTWADVRDGDVVHMRVGGVHSSHGPSDWSNKHLIAIEREVPDSTTLTVPFGPKMLREAFCVAEHAVRQHESEENQHGAPEVLAALIRECDRHRPLGPDGKHGQRHTPTCGCDDVPERYRPEPVPDDAEALRAQLADAERALAEILPFVNELDDGSVYDGSYAQILSDGIGRLRCEVRKYKEAARKYQAEHDMECAEVERLRAKTLPTDLTKCICPWDSEDRGGGHSEIVAEYEPACPVHSEHVYDPRQGMWVERAARMLPKRSEVLGILYPDGKVPLGDSVKVDSLFALFEQGGAAPKVTEEELHRAISDEGKAAIVSPTNATQRVAKVLRDRGIEVAE